MVSAQSGKLWIPKTLFAIFKYGIYALLTVNVFLFFQEEWLASAHTFSGGVSLDQWAEAFAATIDTGAWVVLILIFELETSVFRGRKIKGVYQGPPVMRSRNCPTASMCRMVR